MSVRQLTVIVVSAALIGAALPGPAAAADPRPAEGVSAQAATCNSAWWTPVSSTRTTFVPTTGGTGNANCILGRGNQGWGVVALQNVLRKCYGQSIALDGVFGPATERAVRNAQTWENAVSNAGLVVDGVYGNNTRRAITWPLYTSSGNLDAPRICRYVSWG